MRLRLLIVGHSPSSPRHAGLPAFAQTRSGDRLAHWAGLRDARALLELAETVNLHPHYRERYRVAEARERAHALLPALWDREVVLCGMGIARAFKVPESPLMRFQRVQLGSHEAVVAVVPHPSGRCRAWYDPETCRAMGRLMRRAVAAELLRAEAS